VESGYAGGTAENPTYRDVGTGETGHAEVVRVTFDPKVITLRQILTIFFHAHDPTTRDRQGYDEGTQYRSLILYTSEEQHAAADAVEKEIRDMRVWDDKPLVTEIKPLQKFYRAEEYHQNYYRNNSSKPYCEAVIAPKLAKIRKEFHELLVE
jgi:methionine-S-sulfoxide reductase